MKRKEARFCAAHSQFPRSLILIYLVSDTFPNRERGRGGGGRGRKVFVTFKNGGKGRELCLCSPHSILLSDTSTIK